MASSSSKKVAKAAKAGSRTKVRSQQGLLFPIAIAAIVVIGVLMIVFARQNTQNDAVASPPTLSDHWHAAYGFYLCDAFAPPLPAATSETGIEPQADGLIHIQPLTAAATGKNATLGKFFDSAGVEMTNTKLTLSDGTVYEEGETKCDGEDGQLRISVWDTANDNDPTEYITGFDDIRFINNGMLITIGFVPEGTSLPKPPSESALANPIDLQTTPTTVAGTATTVAGTATTVAGTATTAAGTATTVVPTPTTAAPATTTG